MKDPAVLFYFQDFLVGTEFMTDEEVGKYMRVLCHLADKGSLCKSQILRICKTSTIPEAINEKLSIDENGNFYQRRMREEREKRVNYSESRRANRTKKDDNICKTYDEHMENENENINEDINKDEKKEKNKELRETNFVSEVYQYTEYPIEMLQKFVNYWTEPNKSKTKMRFELEKVFDIKRRLVTWASRDNSFTKNNDNEFEQLKVKLYGKKPV